jgi:peptidoglycan/LPS O-acetylase OafA/YrhL
VSNVTTTGGSPALAGTLAPGPDDGSTAARPHLPFQPGLEGLRGLAVAGVLAFHAGFGWARGGFLGVSTFFTISGYLITSLLIGEHAGTGSISLSGFWSRRFRRLLPASMACLFVAVLFGWLVADPGQLASLRGDVIAALLDVANWRFIITGQSYANLFSGPSPVLQFWSLAIEEQFYLVFPLVVAGVLWAARGSRRALTGVLLGGTLASIAACLVLYQPGDDPSRVYYGTGTRAAELLVGGLLALALARPDSRIRRLTAPEWSMIGIVALTAIVILWHGTNQSDGWLYQGGLAAYAVLSAALIAAILHPGPARSLLSTRGLRWLGAVSYGVYLFHWPIFLWLTPERTHLSIWPLFGLRVAVTLTIADLSYRLLEQPIRKGLNPFGRPLILLMPAVASVLVVALVAVTAHPTSTANLLASGTGLSSQPAGASEPPAAEGSSISATKPTTADHANPSRRVLLVGDSLALTLVNGFSRWNATYGTLDLLNVSWVGCSLTHDGRIKGLNTVRTFPPDCKKARDGWPKRVQDFKPDVVVVLSCLFDVSDHRLPGDSTWRPPGDPMVDNYLRSVMSDDVDTLSAGGATVTFLSCPHLDPKFSTNLKGMAKGPYAESDPARVDRLNQLMLDVAATKPAMTVLDLGKYVRSLPGSEFDPARRPDGVHWSDSGSDEVISWLMPQVQEMPALTPAAPPTPPVPTTLAPTAH